ncbi:MAG: PglZ domain-containing protein [Fimbriiglobus sp.]
MAVVTEYLFQLIAKQVEDKGIVVWYDPEQSFVEVARKLAIPNTTVAHYDGSFFRLRHKIDHLMNGDLPPRLVVYVPMAQGDTHSALVELETAGVVMRPGQQPPNRNTKLSVVARNALRPLLGDDQVAEIERQVESSKLTLADLNALADKGRDISTSVLSLIFGSANPQEVALAFLHGDDHDGEIAKKSAENDLRNLLQPSFDIEESPASASLHTLRERLARHVLLTDLLAGLGQHVPASLTSTKVATSPGGVDACVRLAHSWRNSRDDRDGYVAAANKVEQEFSLGQLAFEPTSLTGVETFLAIERAMLRHVEDELLDKARPDLLQLAVSRLSRFWAEATPAVQARWALIASAAEVLLEADRVSREIKKPPTTVPDLVRAYAEDDEPWCLLDTHHRHMESRKYNFEFDAKGGHQGLEKLITKAGQRYTEVGSALAKHFVTQFSKAKHPINGLLRQRDIFRTQVQPKLDGGKVAYVWVDALRFEMARELCRLLKDDFELTLQPAIGTLPTITEIGMAALLPKAHETIKVVSLGGGKLGLEVGGKVIKDRKDRVAFLKEHAGVPVFDCKLDDLLPKPKPKVKEGIQNAKLVLVTSQEIDEFGESDTKLARLQMDSMLTYLRRGVRILADHGIKTIILAADHGHLFAEEIGDDMKIDAPGGKTADLHRRVWVGEGGTADKAFLRTPLTSLGIESDFDIATPWNTAVFKVAGGNLAYFHGGMSPQELIVPVVVLTSTGKGETTPAGIAWTLTPGTAKLTTRFFSVQVAGSQSESSLFGFEPPKVRIEIRANKKVVSVPVSASYGFEDATGEVKLKIAEKDAKRLETNTFTLMISEDILQKTVGVFLIDATTGAELTAPLTVDVAISM